MALPVAESSRPPRLAARQNVTAASLFPGYDDVVRAIEERRVWA